ncbi:TetR/AcrR family transcriptional regulator [Streptomyces seoulensis]|uniref:TetR/AcrR family transcriptional regulator n=1 Tax=Streptomyces seoulensis TaxID=73044 RepID=A0A4P6TYT0_STRSO|nr:TetR/AcrR family transcriptional regulator [Streptomyces seoulensis]QBJ92022.1 TetR/AcrR family transcriptional regulator [Streptomyces seoulensis]
MPKSPTKRRPITRSALTESAWALFTEKGFHTTSISDIVERAGLTRGAFYSNYRDKEEIFLALYDAHADQLLTELREAAAQVEPGDNPVVGIQSRLVGRTEEERRWFLVSMEFTLHAARHPDLARQLAVHENRLNQGLTEVLGQALTGAGLRPTIPLEDLARLLTALFEGLTAQELTNGPDYDGHHLTPHVISALTEPVAG